MLRSSSGYFRVRRFTYLTRQCGGKIVTFCLCNEHMCVASGVMPQKDINKAQYLHRIAYPTKEWSIAMVMTENFVWQGHKVRQIYCVGYNYIMTVNPRPTGGSYFEPPSRFLAISSKSMQVSPPNLQYPLSQHFYTLC